MAPQVYTIPVPTPFRVGTVNSYLVRSNALMLVDAGPCDELSLAGLERGLAHLGHRIEDIELLVLTHQHYDHLGLAAEIKRRSNSQIAGHRLLAPFAANLDRALESEDAYSDAIMKLNGIGLETRSALREKSAALRRYAASFEVDLELHENDRIDLGDGSFRVIFAPGHSPTDILLVHEESQLAFVGDHLIGHISSNPIMHRPLDREADPRSRPKTLARYIESLEKTAAEDLKPLYPGHGQSIEDHRRLIAMRFAHYHERKARIADEIGAAPTTGARLIDALWPRLAVDQMYLALSEILGHVDLLLAEGAVREQESNGVTEFVAV